MLRVKGRCHEKSGLEKTIFFSSFTVLFRTVIAIVMDDIFGLLHRVLYAENNSHAVYQHRPELKQDSIFTFILPKLACGKCKAKQSDFLNSGKS